MEIDLHTHTHPASSCSAIFHDEYLAFCRTHDVEAIALTNHGSVADNLELEAALAAEGVVLLHGVEVSTLLGDLVIYSPDLDYLARFRDVQEPPRAADVPTHAAVVWVHPAAGGGRSGAAYYPGLEQLVAPLIHAVEVFNGNWLGARYVEVAERIADRLGLPATGGSDAHRPDRLTVCTTEVDGEVAGTTDLVAAIRSGAVRPRRNDGVRRRRFGRLL